MFHIKNKLYMNNETGVEEWKFETTMIYSLVPNCWEIWGSNNARDGLVEFWKSLNGVIFIVLYTYSSRVVLKCLNSMNRLECFIEKKQHFETEDLQKIRNWASSKYAGSHKKVYRHS